jgi:hypothetical protein
MVIDALRYGRSSAPSIAGDVIDAVERAIVKAAHNIDLAIATIFSVEQIVSAGRHAGDGGPGISNRVVAVRLRVLRSADAIAAECISKAAIARDSCAVRIERVGRHIYPRAGCTSGRAGRRSRGRGCGCSRCSWRWCWGPARAECNRKRHFRSQASAVKIDAIRIIRIPERAIVLIYAVLSMAANLVLSITG